MLLAGLLLVMISSLVYAQPVPCKLGSCTVEKLVQVVCERENSWWPCSMVTDLQQSARNEFDSMPLSSLYTYSNHKRQEPTESGSRGPALGTILGGVFGAVGGLAVMGAILYAWWSIKRVKRNHAAHEMNASSSFGGGATHSQLVGQQQASKDSRTSSSNKSRNSKRKPSGAKWQDPWLAAPKSPRTVPVAVKLDRPAGTAPPASGKPAAEDQTSDSSAAPLRIIESNADDDRKAVRDEL